VKNVRGIVFDRFTYKLDGICLVTWKDHKNHKQRQSSKQVEVPTEKTEQRNTINIG